MSFIRYNKSGILEGVESLTSFVTYMDDKLETIESDCKPIVETWDGQASQAYRDRKQSWNASAAKIRDTIIKVTNRLDEGNENMEQVDKMQGAKFGGM